MIFERPPTHPRRLFVGFCQGVPELEKAFGPLYAALEAGLARCHQADLAVSEAKKMSRLWRGGSRMHIRVREESQDRLGGSVGGGSELFARALAWLSGICSREITTLGYYTASLQPQLKP